MGLALAFSAAVPAETDAEQELEAVRDRIEELQRSMRRDTDRRDALSGQLRDAEENVRSARSRLGDIRKRIAESDARLAAIAADRKKSEAALREQREVLAAELRTAYVGGQEEQLKLLLSQEDPAALGRMLVYYSYFGRARAGKIAEIQALVARLDEAAAAEAAERERLAALESDSRQQLSTVDAARDERSRALKAMNARIKSRNDSIAKLKREAASLQKLVTDLRRAMSDLPPTGGQAFDKVRGKLSWPVAGKITAHFGQGRGGGLTWNGVMIEAPRGNAVKAIYDGRVAYADWLPGMGLLLIVDHGGYMSLYAHNEQLNKAVGARVAAGEQIATVGDSGGRAQPGLYLEIRRGAKPVNPVPWFRRPTPP
jgi:septal ring factor EnvC (AmiA/AmiB activator)